MTIFLDYDPDDIDVHVAELLTATHDSADPLVHPKVSEALGLMRRHFRMDVMFVSQFQGNRRTFRVVDCDPSVTKVVAGHSDPLEESWCQFVVDGRAPQLIPDAGPLQAAGQLPRTSIPIGTHISTPIVLSNGAVYGTLCCFSSDVKEGVSTQDLSRLQATARILAEELNRTQAGAELELAPLETAKRLPRPS